MRAAPVNSFTLHAFDRHAGAYSAWEAHPTAQHWRARVLASCVRAFPAGGRVLDVGGGTGVDACALASLGYRVVVAEPSAGMAAVARSRGCEVVPVGAEALEDPALEGAFDGALSDFGALNCVADLPAFGRGLAARLRPGAAAVLVVMGPFALGEAAALLARGRVRALARRRAGSIRFGDAQVPMRWWGERAMRDALPAFELAHVEALGLVQPPPDLHAGSPRLRRIDAALAGVPGLRHLGDHTLYVFRRRP